MNENETSVLEVEAPAPVVAELKSPSVLEFCTIVNSCTKRKEAIARFQAEGYHMTYAALVARIKNYTGKGYNVKSLKGARGAVDNVEEVNAKLAQLEAEQEAAKAIVG